MPASTWRVSFRGSRSSVTSLLQSPLDALVASIAEVVGGARCPSAGRPSPCTHPRTKGLPTWRVASSQPSPVRLRVTGPPPATACTSTPGPPGRTRATTLVARALTWTWADGAHEPLEPCEALSRLVDDLLALADREAHERAHPLRAPAEPRGGDPDDARTLGEVAAERDAVVVAQRGDVGVDEVGPRRAQHPESRALEPGAEAVALTGELGREPRAVRVGEPERGGCRVLERRPAREGEELLDAAHRTHERGRPARPPHLPARDGEGLADRG